MSIQTRHQDKITTITLDRDSHLNALDIPHLQGLEQGLDEAADCASTRVVLLQAKGRAFCVGADIKAMDTMSDAEFAQATSIYQSLCRKSQALVKPVIAAINGYALGGGLEISLMADLRIAAASATLGLPDAELGFSPSGGLTYLLPRIVGKGWAMQLWLAGNMLSAQQALAIGLVTRVVADDALASESWKLAQQIAACPARGIGNSKRALIANEDADLETTLSLEAELDLDCYRDPETREALRRFLASRKK